jgi:NAD(P)-dependent dehydrogenase (short-subunit alcohol dehydrogenase family)
LNRLGYIPCFLVHLCCQENIGGSIPRPLVAGFFIQGNSTNNKDMPTHQQKTWLVTGCSTGFGRAIAQAVLAEGDKLIATARNPDTIEDFVADYPDRAIAIALDVTDLNSIATAVDFGLAQFGSIDVLVNNAGFGMVGAVEELSDGEIRRQFDTNVFGVLNVIRAVLPHMRKRRAGHIINLSSVAGFVASPSLGAYAATKHAVEAFSEAMAQELQPLGIQVTIIEPGSFRTDWAGRSMSHAEQTIEDYRSTAGRLRTALSQTSGRQAGNPAKLAEVLIFDVVRSPNPPLRLALGKDCVTGLRTKAERMLANLQEWEQVSRSTDFIHV